MAFKVPEEYRIKTGALGSDKSIGNNGAFFIRSLKFKQPIRAVVSDGMGWEHVSVSFPNRCPTWGEMCIVKDIFWDEEDMVVQYHPPKSDYVNCHPYTLHLWRSTDQEIPAPPSIMVGPKTG